jgi:hypothetical protein
MAAKMTVFQQQLSGGLATPESSTRSIVSPIISQTDPPYSVKLEYKQDLDFSLPPPHSRLLSTSMLSSPSESSIDDRQRRSASQACDLGFWRGGASDVVKDFGMFPEEGAYRASGTSRS